jgi:hypothetical protein
LFRVNQDTDEREKQMTTRSGTGQKATLANPDSFRVGIEKPADSATANKPGYQIKPQKFTAVFLNAACEHDWFKLANDLQTLAPEGKTIWKCRTCAEITNTYDWQTPQP